MLGEENTAGGAVGSESGEGDSKGGEPGGGDLELPFLPLAAPLAARGHSPDEGLACIRGARPPS